MLGSPSSASAISAALRMACPAAPAFPLADSGKIKPTLKSPVPRLGVDSDAVRPGAAALLRDRSTEFNVPLHPAKPIAVTRAAAIAVGRHHEGARTALASDRLRWKAM